MDAVRNKNFNTLNTFLLLKHVKIFGQKRPYLEFS